MATDLLKLLGGPAQSAGARPAGGAGADTAARWRYELERAQWAQRAGDAAASTGSQAGERGPSSPSGAPASRLAHAADTAGDEQAGRSNPGGDAFDRALGAAKPAFAEGDQVSEQAGRGVPAPNAALEPRASPEAAEAEPQESSPRPESRQWARTHVHASGSDEGARVWVRDASLAGGSLDSLAADLRSRLRAAGLRLSGLVVNGKTVVEAPPQPAARDDRGTD